MPDLGTDCITVLSDAQVLENLPILHRLLVLKPATQRCFLVKRIHLVIVTFHYALVLAHDYVRQEVSDDPSEEIQRLLLHLL